jgi:hypothetical protein
MSWLPFAAIIGAAALGLLAFVRLGGPTGGSIRDALAVIRNGLFVLSGVFLILGGFVIVGALVIALFVFLGAGAAKSLYDDSARSWIAPD